MIKINEIFYSIQGESSLTGWPTVFVRTSGCNLRCTYCDTKYSYYEGALREVSEVIKEVESHGARHVCLTGGEPLLQAESLELMKKLCDLGYIVSLETSGSKPCHKVDSRVLLVIDVKTPESGAANSFDSSNLNLPNHKVEFKFVIGGEKDFEWAEDLCRQHEIFKNNLVLYSPSFEVVTAQWLSEKILLNKSTARLQLQLHKYIWSPALRGV